MLPCNIEERRSDGTVQGDLKTVRYYTFEVYMISCYLEGNFKTFTLEHHPSNKFKGLTPIEEKTKMAAALLLML